MAVDFQIVFPQESIQINAVSGVDGSTSVIDVLGADFTSVDSVLVNDVEAPSYYVVSKTRMFVTLPSLVPSGTVTSVAVTSSRLTISDQSLLKFRVSRIPSKVSGILRLVQLFTKVLFTTPGSDIFNRRMGGGGLRSVGRNFSKAESGAIISDFVVAVDNTTRQIVTIQGRQPQLPSDVRILAARVASARFSAQEAALVVSVELTSQAGRSARANVVF